MNTMDTAHPFYESSLAFYNKNPRMDTKMYIILLIAWKLKMKNLFETLFMDAWSELVTIVAEWIEVTSI